MSVTEKHTLETVTDNFLVSHKSLGQPQTPQSTKHQAIERPGTWEWFPEGCTWREGAVTKTWNALYKAEHSHCVHVFQFLGSLIHQNELY